MKLKNYILWTLSIINSHQFFSQATTLMGKNAPLFSATMILPGGSKQEFNLKDYDDQLIVLYFYPMDNSPTCSIQAKNLANGIEDLKKNGIKVFGISTDSEKSHQKFMKKLKLPYPLISDKNGIAKLYKSSGFFGAKRHTFLIKNGKIIKVFVDITIKNQIPDIITHFAKS